MDWILIGLVSCGASALTLFSGFGLGTLLLPAFALVFPAELAVAMTAVVHLANNLFKLVLMGRYAKVGTVALFGLPAVVAAFAGAWLLVWLADVPPIGTWSPAGPVWTLTPVKVALAALMILFALLEIWPAFAKLSLPPAFLPLGGLLSGFFGGLSGHQGALRSAFLLRAGLSKEGFIGTGVVIACLVDGTRLSLYGKHLSSALSAEHRPMLVFAMVMAWLGVIAGNRLLNKVTLRKVQLVVAGMLFVIALLLGSGII